MKKLVEGGLISGIAMMYGTEENTFCASCTYMKATQKSMPKVCNDANRTTAFGEEIHSDLWGPTPIQMLSHCHYYASFTDDFSWLTHLYLLRCKSDTFQVYKEYVLISSLRRHYLILSYQI